MVYFIFPPPPCCRFPLLSHPPFYSSLSFYPANERRFGSLVPSPQFNPCSFVYHPSTRTPLRTAPFAFSRPPFQASRQPFVLRSVRPPVFWGFSHMEASLRVSVPFIVRFRPLFFRCCVLFGSVGPRTNVLTYLPGETGVHALPSFCSRCVVLEFSFAQMSRGRGLGFSDFLCPACGTLF